MAYPCQAFSFNHYTLMSDQLHHWSTPQHDYISGLCNSHVEQYYDDLSISAEEAFQYKMASGLEWMANEEATQRELYSYSITEGFPIGE